MTRDMTRGQEWKILLTFALPMMGAQFLHVMYQVVDSIVVGNFVSATALGAVSIPGPVIWIASALASGMGTGTNIIIAQYFGAKRDEDIRSAAATSILFCSLLGIAVTAAVLVCAKPLLWGLLQSPVEMRALSLQYLAVYSGGFVFQMAYQVFYGIMRAFGDSRDALVVLLIAAVLNVALDLLFVAVFRWGVIGAALASVISQMGSCFASLFIMRARFPAMRFRWKELRIQREKLGLILRLSVPVSLQMVVQAAGFLLLQRMVNSFGPASIEGFATMGRTEEIMHVPVVCMSAAIASFVGQNIGAGDTGRASRGIRAAMWISLAISALMGTLMFLFDEKVLGLYNITGESLLRGREHLDLMCLLLPVFTVQQIANGALQGAGDVKVPTVSSLTDLVLRLAGTWVLSMTAVGFRSIYLSTPLAWITACLISVIRCRSGAWKEKAIASP